MTAQKKAKRNLFKYLNRNPWPEGKFEMISFTKPNFKIGYGGMLKALESAGGKIRTRAELMKAIGRPAYYYPMNFKRLTVAKLMKYSGGFYRITKLGRQFLAENCK